MTRKNAWPGIATLVPLLFLFAVIGLALVLPAPVLAQGEPGKLQLGPTDTISLTLVADNLSRPVDITAAPGDRSRLFVVEKPGRVRIVTIQGGTYTLLPAPFLDITSIVNASGNEQGLLGIAFHPDYDSNGYFFVNYTAVSPSGDTVVARYSVSQENANLADPNSATILMTIDQPYSNHNGGQLKFGPDGYLYIGTGDGGSGGDPLDNAQDPAELLGKMLRIDVDSGTPYGIPPDNPFIGVAGAQEEIWALGLRNPWRFSFDRLTGDQWIGDVGQGQWEEIDLEPAGSSGGYNWGWRCYEGNHVYNSAGCGEESDYDFPVYEYSHSEGLAITGGFVFRGSPNSAYFGDYFFCDYYFDFFESQLRTLQHNGLGWVRVNHTVQAPAGRSLTRPTSFGEDAMGDLYIADDSGGEIFKLELRPATCVSGNYDVNGDGGQDVIDIQLVAEDWLRSDFVPDFDVDCSGAVDVIDIQLVAGAWTS
ncbi:MAG: PQQ-dependent sugar dehydrogenase [Chloroflexota bacterium]|nr:PQQ-dependent sugar dehydrogenase [Chloroflexota bacterium]